MKIECYECKEEFDKDSPDIIYKVVAESQTALFYGFICRECKDIMVKEKEEKRLHKTDKWWKQL